MEFAVLRAGSIVSILNHNPKVNFYQKDDIILTKKICFVDTNDFSINGIFICRRF